MWNKTDIPLAYLITFRSYGTWLHGDERGSIDRFNNGYQSRYIAPNEQWKTHNLGKLKREPVTLNSAQRNAIEQVIREVCVYREWLLRAVNVRTNHAHTVVSIGDAKPEFVLNSFKSYATRRLRKDGLWQFDSSPWSERGSKRRLWNERSIEIAVDYVINGQGDELPNFD